MSYDEIVKQQFENKYNIVQENLLKKDTLFPSVSDRTKYLDSGRTLVLQLLFTLKVGFLEEFTTIFSFVYSKHTFEKLILSLEEEDWIISKPSKAFGKAFILSENALHFIYTKSKGTNGENAAKGKFPLDSFPSDKKLKAHKLLNGMVARQSQKVLLDLINTHFHEFPKDKRKEYTQGQFLINYVYPSNKTTLTFTKKDVAIFLEGATKELNENEELYARYLAFVKRNQRELIAEGSSFVVCHALGLDTKDYSFPYLQAWLREKDELKALATTIQKIASKILSLLIVEEAAPSYV